MLEEKTQIIIEEKVEEILRKYIFKTGIRDMVAMFSEINIKKIVRTELERIHKTGQIPSGLMKKRIGIKPSRKRYKLFCILLKKRFTTAKEIKKELGSNDHQYYAIVNLLKYQGYISIQKDNKCVRYVSLVENVIKEVKEFVEENKKYYELEVGQEENDNTKRDNNV